MNAQIRLSDVVALTEDIPDRGLLRGQVGTVVELLGPGVVEVEFVKKGDRLICCGPCGANRERE